MILFKSLRNLLLKKMIYYQEIFYVYSSCDPHWKIRFREDYTA